MAMSVGLICPLINHVSRLAMPVGRLLAPYWMLTFVIWVQENPYSSAHQREPVSHNNKAD